MKAIRLPKAIEIRLEKLAKRAGRTKSSYVREAVVRHLEDLEDIYLAEIALAKIRNDEETPIPLEEVLKRYALSASTNSTRRRTPSRN
jgi:RHH-type transcriptional regulator, rel operon repressor / antitoxin RelB